MAPAALGPRFAAVMGSPAGWVPADELFGDRLAEHVAQLAARRGAPHAAVAGALLVQQYAGLVVAPALAALHECGRRLPYGRAAIRARTVDGAPVRIAFADAATPLSGALPGSLSNELGVLARELLGDHLGAVADAVHRHCRTGRQVLDGEVATAVATAYLHLSWRRPDRAALVADARAVLAAAGLASLVVVEAAHVDDRPWMATGRRTCCLAFRTARNREQPDPYCALCPVRPQAQVRAAFEQAVRSYAARHPDEGPAP